MTDSFAITAKFIGATNTRGSRVSICVPEFEGRKVIDYCHTYRDAGENARVWLIAKGIIPSACAPLNPGFCVFTVDRSNWLVLKSAFNL